MSSSHVSSHTHWALYKSLGKILAIRLKQTIVVDPQIWEVFQSFGLE